MRKITKEYNVYGFEELDKSIQESILEKYIKMEFELYCDSLLEGDMAENAYDTLKQYFKGALYKDVLYDLSYSQGSGSMIEFEIDLENVNNKYNVLTKEEIEELESFGDTTIKVFHRNNHYYHEYTFDIEYTDFTIYGYEWEKIKDINDVVEKEAR